MLKLKIAYHKLSNWEYWPVWLVYLPCFFIYPIYAIRSRSALFFTAANPGITNGGAFMVPKDEIYSLLPEQMIPKTLLWDGKSKLQSITNWLNDNELTYPILLKPNHGLRGLGLSIASSKSELEEVISKTKAEYLIQEFVEYENEAGIFFTKDPEKKNIEITSIVKKGFINIIGDGKRSIEKLLLENNRYAIQLETLRANSKVDFETILDEGRGFAFEKIGNHSRGAVFLDGHTLHTQGLKDIVKEILSYVDGVYYGRIDLKYDSDEELSKGRGYKVIEINGAFSEPGHIYDPSYTLWNAWKVIVKHFSYLFRISRSIIDTGFKPMHLFEGLQLIGQHFKTTRSYSQ